VNDGPGGALLLRDFVNTAEPQVGGEEWTSPAAARDWLSGHGLLAGAEPDAPLGPADLRRLRVVREGLREILHGHGGHAVDPAAVDALDAELAAVPLRLSFGADGRPRLTAASSRPVEVAVAALLSAVEDAVRDGTWERLKACSRDTCRWAFYDESRNRSGRWCSMSGCGNIMKMRRAHARGTRPLSSAGG
jgi:predicted RNA-binding Zn ribbon-like protein